MVNLPTGFQIKAARSLVGWKQRDLAKAAGVDVATVIRMEKCGPGPIKTRGLNIQATLDALRGKGVEITEDGVFLSKKSAAKRNR
jgi:DNA-binding XRE family transcriptional regulator